MTTLQIVSSGRSYDLDTVAGRLLREHNEVVPLSPKQWALLHYLAKNPNRLVSKDELIEHVWKNAAVTDDAVAQTIRALRRVFDDESKSPAFIESEYGRGYRFIAEVSERTHTLLEPDTTKDSPSSALATPWRASLDWCYDPKQLVERLLNASPDPQSYQYIAPMLLVARRLGKKFKLSDAYFRSINVMIRDIDEMRTNMTYPAPAHMSVNDLELIIDELESIEPTGGKE